ncbi:MULTISPECIES: mechanosensitive ion channel family protein [unclassified Sphingobium]|uniref:mechanosensitive ion channel family protein n=1 Tax=unclassified Sphingobium TaxID=2611147 RepID=UPI00146D3B71|nr:MULTISPECIES: mechanosensitive ion channel domain-containing protein [unclassified Sphingobium]NML91160.1 mechanosensitive ion channel [Sphingobium sp. TB-6]WDA36979.1 mechanosensitive ion channel [Sphingobium sp. YC-XJ3]
MITNMPLSPDSIGILAHSYVREPWMQAGFALLVLTLVAWVANWVTKRIVLKLLLRLAGRLGFNMEASHLGRMTARLSNIVPTLVIQLGLAAIPHLPPQLEALAQSLCTAFIMLTVALALAGGLDLLHDFYQRRHDAVHRPIKGYVQVGKLLVYGAAAILILAALMNQSPFLLLSGLGAMAAVLMLVFKDTILSLVASVQIGSNDMVRVGDWIEMPQLDANGDVVDIALHTVKVQNFDKTITTIPTHRLISESFRNWRGMAESGGRRIMRSIMIDQNSIAFLDDAMLESLSRFELLKAYLDGKLEELGRWNDAQGAGEQVNTRRLTNIGTFRAYMLAYLEARTDIASDKTLLVRQLAPGEYGLPLEIYAFADTTEWAEYERIQGDIFDHLLAILPEFGLRLFQRPTGVDVNYRSMQSAA